MNRYEHSYRRRHLRGYLLPRATSIGYYPGHRAAAHGLERMTFERPAFPDFPRGRSDGSSANTLRCILSACVAPEAARAKTEGRASPSHKAGGCHMDRDRRRWIKGGGLALLGSGFLSRVDRVAAMQTGGASSLTRTLGDQAKAGKSEALLLKPRPGEEGPPAPAKADRLGLDWNKATVARLKAKLADRDIQAFLIRDHLNIIYLTGYWHIETERPQAAFMNKDDAAPWYLYPGLDRDLVTGWWFGGGWTYFDFLHAEGGHPYHRAIHQ